MKTKRDGEHGCVLPAFEVYYANVMVDECGFKIQVF